MPDLFDFFKENESQLHERPPEQAWQKLEKKLDKSRKRKQRGIRFMQLGTVALALLLLLLAAAMVWYFTRSNTKSGSRTPTPRVLHSDAGPNIPPFLKSFSWLLGEWTSQISQTSKTINWDIQKDRLRGTYKETTDKRTTDYGTYYIFMEADSLVCGQAPECGTLDGTLGLHYADTSRFVFSRIQGAKSHYIRFERIGQEQFVMTKEHNYPNYHVPIITYHFERPR